MTDETTKLETARSSDPAIDEREQEILDTALRESDQLLARSLHDDEARRRKRLVLFALLIGGVAMTTFFVALLAGWLTLGVAGDARAKSPAKPTREQIQQAEQLTAKGWQLLKKQEMLQAAKNFEKAAKLDPKAENAWNGLGWARFNSGQTESALAAFEECVKLNPKHPAALNGLGQIHFFFQEYDDAEKYLKRAARYNATAAWWGLAKLYLIQGEFKKAQPWAEKILKQTPNDETARQMLDAAKAGELPDELRAMIEPAGKRRASKEETNEANKPALEADAHPDSALIAECLEELRKTAVAYDLSFDQVTRPETEWKDPDRLQLFPSSDSWPEMLGRIIRDPEQYQLAAPGGAKHDPDAGGGTVFTKPLSGPVRIANYQTLIFLDGIAKSGSVLIDSYAVLYCKGEMAGVINSQSYSTTFIRGDATGRMRNASYGHWVITGKLKGLFEQESAGMLVVLGGLEGRIKLRENDRWTNKVLLAGYTPESVLKQIEGPATVLLEDSDLEPGTHQVGELTVRVLEK